MRNIFLILLLTASLEAYSQGRDHHLLEKQTYLLSHTVFGTKDSLTLEHLFSKTLSYGHSKGKVENRQEAIKAISSNSSSYTDTAVSRMSILIQDKTAIVRHFFVAKELKQDGTIVPLNFIIMLTWVKQKRNWKLMGRQAVAISN